MILSLLQTHKSWRERVCESSHPWVEANTAGGGMNQKTADAAKLRCLDEWDRCSYENFQCGIRLRG